MRLIVVIFALLLGSGCVTERPCQTCHEIQLIVDQRPQTLQVNSEIPLQGQEFWQTWHADQAANDAIAIEQVIRLALDNFRISQADAELIKKEVVRVYGPNYSGDRFPEFCEKYK